MVVYVEYVFINNLITDYALMRSTLMIMRKKSKKARLFLVAIFGAITSLLLPFINDLILPIYKIFVGIILGFLSVKKDTLKEYAKIILMLFLFTFFVGGMLIGVTSIFSVKEYSIVYLPLQFLPVIIIAIFSLILSINLKKKFEVNKLVYDCDIFIGKSVIKCKGFLDTGNRVFSVNTPLIICSKEISKKVDLAQNNGGTYALKLTTIAGETNVKVVENAEILIYFSSKKHIHKNVVLGLTENCFLSDVILHPSLID